METVLTLNEVEGDAAMAQLEGAFSALAKGSGIVLAAGQDMRPLLNHFQKKQWGKFDWFPLSDGPDRWQVALYRTRQDGDSRGLREFMTFDHRRCDELYAQMESAAQNGQADAAGDFFAFFRTGMDHHFKMEETGFFPAFEKKTGMTQGPTTVMRMEHEQMRGIMRQMADAVNKQDLDGFVRGGTTLLMVMQQHNVKEEQMLYAMGEMHLRAEANELLKQMQRM